MTAKPTLDAIILLYPSSTRTTKELRGSLSDFCAQNNISIVDIITLADEYDYFAMRRLSQIIKYNTKPISLVTNRNLLTTIPPLTLLSILEATNSANSFSIVLDFLRELKERADKSDYQTPEDFRILNSKEVSRISDWMSDMQYTIMRDSRGGGESRASSGF